MISELICLDIVLALHGRTTTVTQTFNLDDKEAPKEQKSEERNSLSDARLVRPLLARYELADIDAAIRWLQLGDYLGKSQWGMRGPWVHVLTAKGVAVAERRAFPPEDHALFYLEEPHQVFLAHQFCDEDAVLERAVRDGLVAGGYRIVDGKVDGLEQFRHAILAKLRASRFFLCLLTHRAKLESGLHVSSVWLYQEIGAAVAMRKSPLLLVEDGMDPHFAGELQKTYEYIPFERSDLAAVAPQVVSRFNTDLETHHIPLPTRTG